MVPRMNSRDPLMRRSALLLCACLVAHLCLLCQGGGGQLLTSHTEPATPDAQQNMTRRGMPSHSRHTHPACIDLTRRTTQSSEKFGSGPLSGRARSCGSGRVPDLVFILRLAKLQGWAIFPRNGLLLGIARHGGFLPNEGIDADLGIMATSLPAIEAFMDRKPMGFEGYTFHVQASKATDDNALWHNRDPWTTKPLPVDVNVKRNGTKVLELAIFFLFRGLPARVFYPFWAVDGSNMDGALVEAELWAAKGAAAVMLGDDGVTLQPLTMQHKAGNLGRAMYVFNARDFEEAVDLPFYEYCVSVPRGYDAILRVFYGRDWRVSNEERHDHASVAVSHDWVSAPPLELCG